MSSDEIAISVSNLGKCYEIYASPRDRLKQFILPRLQQKAGQIPKQYFREFWALRDISFEIKKGETVGIIGRNGSGKSTLLQMICGTLNPSSGSIQTNGRIAALLELGSGFNPEFSGRENVYMNASVLGLTTAEIDARFDDIVAFADIGEFIEQPVKTYSSGMTVRLAFAVIAHVDADILVVDEALSVGDAFFTQKCMRFLRTFMESGTVLFVSHDTGAVVNLCSKAILLNGGRIIETGSPKHVIEHYLANLYETSQDVDGAKTEPTRESIIALEAATDYHDMRRDMVNGSALRNDIEIFQFEPTQNGFGTGHATIESVRLLDENHVPLSWVVGGEDVILEISCRANKEILTPIIGFQFKDRLGQVIFSDNTFLVYKNKLLSTASGEQIVASFMFRLPVLPSGDYSISPAIAEGTQEEHVQHHWIHDAMVVRVHSTSVFFGLIGIPMKKISLEIK
ncbi:lipopolysaccharide transport system ATP-binding protein [Actimicrobium sp. GrIS 1.19]|uniref:ABC transporter ATP-binding protein n=1 Tax=Actimicrobium sp. GrIS 1.19 TaxID=3071708 RepID=UPI002E0804E3|nr:lipopolysaccharide transport system ATP-binding protein [Actimicrobium sp. GrIS 1.19]